MKKSMFLTLAALTASGHIVLAGATILYDEDFQDAQAGETVDGNPAGTGAGIWKVYTGEALAEAEPSKTNLFLKVGPGVDIKANSPGSTTGARDVDEFNFVSLRVRIAGEAPAGSSVNFTLYGGKAGGIENTIFSTYIYHKTGLLHTDRAQADIARLTPGVWYTFEYRILPGNAYRLKVYATANSSEVLVDGQEFPFIGTNKPNIKEHYNFRIQTGNAPGNLWDFDDIRISTAL